ncbi:MAG: tetratricopeptide repeat protein [Thermoanaerobaculia bacterium]
MRRQISAFTLLLLLLPLAPASATCGGGGGGGMGGVSPGGAAEAEVYRVPWKVLSSPSAPAPGESGLSVLWFPVSRDEAKGSQLLESRYLTVSIAPCSGFWIVPNDAAAVRVKYGAVDGTSMAVLVDGDGLELARALPEKGELRVGNVEKMIRGELDKRREVSDARLSEAQTKEKAGEADVAAGLYQEIYSQRCLFPGAGRKAQKALKKMGKPVGDENAEFALPDVSPAKNEEMVALLEAGLKAEFELRIDDARRAYESAHAADPADPVAMRFLAEFHRHQTGDWALARSLFSDILARPTDAISRAVALHGLGKMTIHAGDFKRGVSMFEESIATYPLPLTYRNLAVYWNSEGKPEKAWGYVEQALALAPDDLYNRIFAATYLVGQGKPAEAERIAKANDSILEASYNLAAIWSQLGQKEKALELLARHFYQYERFDPVRTREMQEARDDIAFASYHKDKDFVALTELATKDPDSYHQTR